MCLAVPMKVVELTAGELGIAELDGVAYEVNLSLVDAAAIGDYVIVHAGFAIEMLDEVEATERLQLFAALAQQSTDSP